MKRILVVDDFRANVIMIQQALAGKYDISTATSGREALHMLRGNKPDLMILDIQMPEMNGIDLLKEMKADLNMKNIPVVFLTGQADRENVIQGYRLGIKDVIAKPIIIRTVEERISKVFEQLEREKEEEHNRVIAAEEEKTENAPSAFEDLFDDEFWANSDWDSLF